MTEKYEQLLDLLDDIDSIVFLDDTLKEDGVREVFLNSMKQWKNEISGRDVALTYFTNTGKYYADGKYNSRYEYDFEIYREVKEMTEDSFPLPGLLSERWDGYILVEPENGVPAIVFCSE